MRKDSPIYEEVGPALPPHRNVNMNTNKLMTANALYSPEEEYAEGNHINFIEKMLLENFITLSSSNSYTVDPLDLIE